MPHPPYKRDANCNQVDISAQGDFVSFRWEVRQKYIGFLKCGNRQVQQMLDWLIVRDPSAIIILLGDHGAYFTNRRHAPWELGAPLPGPQIWKKEAFDEAYAQLSAVRVPSPCRQFLRDDLSPVNLFRLVFSCLTNTEPNYLPSKSFWINEKDQKLELIRNNDRWKLAVP